MEETEYEISEVTSEMEGETFPLTYDINSAYFAADIPLLGRTQGNRKVVFRARDFGGSSKTDSMLIRYDRRPELQVRESRPFLAVDEEIGFHISCVDTPFTRCTIDAYPLQGSSPPLHLFSATDLIDTLLTLSGYDTIRIIGTDSVGQRDTVDRKVWHFSQKGIIPVDTFDYWVSTSNKTTWRDGGFYGFWCGVVFRVDTSFGTTKAVPDSRHPVVSVLRASVCNNRIILSGVSGGETVKKCVIVDLAGNVVKTFDAPTIRDRAVAVLTGDISAGTYLLRIVTDARVCTVPVAFVR
ncbi:MAG: hypothetical protein JW913_11055 [Chitinispirillaceae bacterium]|nr:hypothetical protein [Chitinispirillaceae bacterium]